MKTITNKLIKKFENHLINEEKSVATLEKYVRDVQMFAKWLGDRVLDKGAVLRYKSGLTEKYAPASVNSVISSLNSFFDFCERHDLRIKSIKIQRQIFAAKDKELTKAEYARLLCAARNSKNKRMYYLMQTICACGLRVSELEYDKSALEFESNKFSESFGGAIPMINPSYNENSVKVSVLSTDKISAGEICEIKFVRKSQKENGLKLKNIAAADLDGNIIEVNKSEKAPTEGENGGGELKGESSEADSNDLSGGHQAGLPSGIKDNSSVGSSQSEGGDSGNSQAGAKEFRFLDVKKEAWYYKAVKFAFGEGITSVVSEENYAPDDFEKTIAPTFFCGAIVFFIRIGYTISPNMEFPSEESRRTFSKTFDKSLSVLTLTVI